MARTRSLLLLPFTVLAGCSPLLVPVPPDRALWSKEPPPTCNTRDWPVVVDLTVATAALTGAGLGAYHWNDTGSGFEDIVAKLMVLSFTPVAAGFGWSGYVGYQRNDDCRTLRELR